MISHHEVCWRGPEEGPGALPGGLVDTHTQCHQLAELPFLSTGSRCALLVDVQAMKSDPSVLEFCPKGWLGEHQFMLNAIKITVGQNKGQSWVVLEALRTKGAALQYASPASQSDPALVVEATEP
eukprot:3453714-Amphidinium_carterae.1